MLLASARLCARKARIARKVEGSQQMKTKKPPRGNLGGGSCFVASHSWQNQLVKEGNAQLFSARILDEGSGSPSKLRSTRSAVAQPSSRSNRPKGQERDE
jgi:hypothetical protein